MLRACLYLVVIFHFMVVFTNIAAALVLPFTSLIMDWPFWFTVLLVTPIESLIITLTFSREQCPITRLENVIRRRLGLREIGGFIGYYLIKMKWRKSYASKRHAQNSCCALQQSGI